MSSKRKSINWSQQLMDRFKGLDDPLNEQRNFSIQIILKLVINETKFIAKGIYLSVQ